MDKLFYFMFIGLLLLLFMKGVYNEFDAINLKLDNKIGTSSVVIHKGNKCLMCGRELYIEEVRQADGWIDPTPVERK